MIMINMLRKLNNELLNYYDVNSKEYELQLKIKNILTDDTCFYRIKIETAYAILRDLGIHESDLKIVYKQLIKPYV